jgi:putative ABC transport system permease protein
MKYLYLVWSNLKRKKIRTVLTVLSITVAFVLFGYLGAIRQGFSQGIDVAGLDRLIVRHKVSIIQLLPEAYESRIEQVDGVVDAVYQTWFGGVYQKPSNFFAQMPVNPQEYLEMYPEFILSDEEREAWLATRSGAIAGRGIAERFGWKVGDRIPINATVWTRKGGERTWEFDLVGIYDGAENLSSCSVTISFMNPASSARARWVGIRFGSRIRSVLPRRRQRSMRSSPTHPTRQRRNPRVHFCRVLQIRSAMSASS